MKTSKMLQALIVTGIVLVAGLPGRAQDQMLKWYFPGQYLDFTVSPPAPGGSYSPSTGFISNGLCDRNGSLQFYIVDGFMYDASQAMRAPISIDSWCREIVILPYAGDCHKFWAFYTYSATGGQVYVSLIDIRTGNWLVSPWTDVPLGSYSQPNGLAVSAPVDGQSYLYIATNSQIKRWTVNNTISSEMNIASSVFNGYNNYLCSELELSNDGTKLAGTIRSTSTPSLDYPDVIFVIDLDAYGQYASHTLYTYPGGLPDFICSGLEFNDAGTALYVSLYDGSTTINDGIHRIDLSTHVITGPLTGSQDFHSSQLEKGRDGLIYAVNLSDHIQGFDPTTDLPSGAAISGIAVTKAKFTSAYYDQRLLPDQIDGLDYVSWDAPDIWAKDNKYDVGLEPNPYSGPMWESPDIWCNPSPNAYNGPHKNPEYGEPTYVYAEIRNRGCDLASGKVRFYFTKATLSMAWPWHWDNYTPNWVEPLCDPTALWGDEITPVPIPVAGLAPGASTVVKWLWTNAPDPDDFLCFGTNKGHFCLLARIETDSLWPYGMTFDEVWKVETNARNNNNIVWKNVEVVDLKPNISSGNISVLVQNNKAQATAIDLTFSLSCETPGGELVLLDDGAVGVGLGEVWDLWQGAGGSGTGFEQAGDSAIRLTDTVATLTDIPFDSAEMHIISVEFLWRDSLVHESRNFTFRAQQSSDSAIDGGVTYDIRFCPRVEAISPAPQDICTVDDPVITVEFDDDMDPATINDSSFLVQGQMSGSQVGAITYDAPSRTATFAGAVLETGELVNVVLTTEIATTEGAPLCNSYVWSFYASATADGYVVNECEWRSLVGPNPRGIAAADFNRDGAPDLATANNGSNTISVLMNSGGPYDTDILEPKVDYPVSTGPWGVCVADLNRDGAPDIAAANISSSEVSVLINNGDGTFGESAQYSTGVGPRGIYSADIDGDGYPDLVTGGSGSHVSVLINDGSGVFSSHTEYATPSDHYSVFAADVNGDFAVDIIAPNYSSNNVSVFTNRGDGTFGDDSVYATGSHPTAAQCVPGPWGELVGDILGYYPDIVATDWMSNTVSVFPNDSHGVYASRAINTVGAGPHAICVFDLEGDGDMDLVTANYHGDSVSILQNDGEDNYNPYWNVGVGGGPVDLAAADFNGDGYIDLAVANFDDGTVSLLLIVDEGCCIPPTVGDVDQSGVVDITDVSVLIDNQFLTLTPLVCEEEGDVDFSGTVDISDLSILIDNQFLTLNPLPPCP